MLFSSVLFLYLFLPIALLGYYLINKNLQELLAFTGQPRIFRLGRGKLYTCPDRIDYH